MSEQSRSGTDAGPESRNAALIVAEYSDASPGTLSGGAVLSARHQRRIANAVVRRDGQMGPAGGSQIIASLPTTGDAVRVALEIQAILLEERSADAARSGLSGRIGVAVGELTFDDNAIRGVLVQQLRRALSHLPLNSVGITAELRPELPDGVSASAKPHTGAGRPTDLALYSLRTSSAVQADTQMAPPTLSAEAEVFSELQISVRGRRSSIGAAQCPWLVGRDENSHTVLTGGMASRHHGRIEFEDGKFFYVDESVNGSYILTGTGNEIHLRDDRFLLLGSGAISPGIPIAEQKVEVIRFECVPVRLGIKSEEPMPSTRRLR